MAENLECPECHEPIAPDDFQCEHCELLLNPQLASGEYVISDPSIVRALLSPPQRTTSREMPALRPRGQVDDAVTARFSVPLGEDTVPYLTAGLDLALQPLHPFEAYVASFLDGTQTVAALARSAKLPEIEVKVVLKTLFEMHLVELHRQPAPAAPEDSLPLLDGADFLEEARPPAKPKPVVATPPPPPPPPPPRAEPPPPRNPFSLAPAPPRSSRTGMAAIGSGASVATPPPIAPVATPPPVAPLAPPVAAAPEHHEDYLQRAVRFEREGQVDRAIELLKRGLARSASPGLLYNKLALILVNQRKDYAQAMELLERAAQLEPHNPVFQQNLLKVTALVASTPGGPAPKKRGLLGRLTGRGG